MIRCLQDVFLFEARRYALYLIEDYLMALRQHLIQKLEQRLSPQQIQLMKLLQVPTMELDQRIKQDILISPDDILTAKHGQGLGRPELKSTVLKVQDCGQRPSWRPCPGGGSSGALSAGLAGGLAVPSKSKARGFA